MEILLKSALERPDFTDGPRYLIETTWPDNVQDLDVSPYRWIRELVPSYQLVQMSQKMRWPREYFQRVYWAELERPEAQKAIKSMLAEGHDYVTFLYADPSFLKSNAYYLKKYITAYQHKFPVPQFVQGTLALAA
jgi:uncharacterized protein YeaO (DUF488 family)